MTGEESGQSVERVYRREDVYRATPQHGERGFPKGPIATHDLGPNAPCAIGFCPRCGENARQTCQIRGLFDCPNCTFYWHDERVGKQTRTFDDFFGGGAVD